MSVVRCAHCGSRDTEVELNTVLCLSCGEHTDTQGRPRPKHVKFIAPNHQERKAKGEVQ